MLLSQYISIFHYSPVNEATVKILKHTIQRNFCSHFRLISWACFLFQLSHLIWWYLAVSGVGSGPSTLCHCYWCCSDFHEAKMRSHLLKRNNFHWAKSDRMNQWIGELWDKWLWSLCTYALMLNLDMLQVDQRSLFVAGEHWRSW